MNLKQKKLPLGCEMINETPSIRRRVGSQGQSPRPRQLLDIRTGFDLDPVERTIP